MGVESSIEWPKHGYGITSLSPPSFWGGGSTDRRDTLPGRTGIELIDRKRDRLIVHGMHCYGVGHSSTGYGGISVNQPVHQSNHESSNQV